MSEVDFDSREFLKNIKTQEEITKLRNEIRDKIQKRPPPQEMHVYTRQLCALGNHEIQLKNKAAEEAARKN